jgi:hypothetical protein
MTAKVFDLKYPFELQGRDVRQLTARRPKVIDVRKFIKNVDVDSVKAMETLLSDLCSVPPDIIANVDIEDFPPMKNWAEDFLRLMLTGGQES